MDAPNLAIMIERLLRSAQARAICRNYHADPLEAWGEIWSRLLVRAAIQTIANPRQWVKINGLGILRNYLRRECVVRP